MSILFSEDGIDLFSSRCMSDPNFMDLAHTVAKKHVEIPKLNKKLQSQ